jgi:hypothetical protein
VKFILDDQVGRPKQPVGLGRNRGIFSRRLMRVRVFEFRRSETVARAISDLSEKRLHLPLPCHLRKLIDGRDHHGGSKPVDLFINDQQREFFVQRLSPRIFAFGQGRHRRKSACVRGPSTTPAKRNSYPLREREIHAQFNVGRMYGEDKGVPQNVKQAIKWYRLAAEKRNSSAQTKLGEAPLGSESGIPHSRAPNQYGHAVSSAP